MIEINDSGITIDGLRIDIPAGPIGIGFTGGADSTILSYILMKYHPGMIHFFTIAAKNTERGEALTTIKIIDKLMKMTSRTENFMQHIVYLDKTTNENIGDYLMSQCSTFKTDVVYTGLTQKPPDGIINAPIYDNQTTLRNPNIIKETYRRNGKLYHPLINIDKRGIKKLYDIFEIADELIPMTASCVFTHYDSPIKGVRGLNIDMHCGNCWWCEERKWALGRL